MRVVSLLPSATEWMYAIGAGELLVGRSHACDYPPEVADLPVLTASRIQETAEPQRIHEEVSYLLQRGLSIYEVFLDRLQALAPDIIVTQAQCEVCAVSERQLEGLLAGWIGKRPRLFSMHPMTFKQVLDHVLQLGVWLGRAREAMAFIAEAEIRLKRLRHQLFGTAKEFPTVVCIEWLSPLMTAGHWMPDVVGLAGGHALLASKGYPSPVVTFEALLEADPAYIALMPCGFTIDQTRSSLHWLIRQQGWETLQAVRNRRVYLLDGNAYFNRPGPRLYRSVELLAFMLYGELPEGISPPESWELQLLDL